MLDLLRSNNWPTQEMIVDFQLIHPQLDEDNPQFKEKFHFVISFLQSGVKLPCDVTSFSQPDPFIEPGLDPIYRDYPDSVHVEVKNESATTAWVWIASNKDAFLGSSYTLSSNHTQSHFADRFITAGYIDFDFSPAKHVHHKVRVNVFPKVRQQSFVTTGV